MGKVSASALLLVGFAAVAGAQTPRIDSIDPTQGPIVGGTFVTILGSGFTGASVDIDAIPTVPISRTDTRIQVQMPPHDNGYALLKVSVSTGDAFAEFLYVPPKLRDLPPGSITTVAGVGARDGFSRPATQTNVHPWGLAADGAGNTYVVSSWFNRAFHVTSAGLLEPFIGDGSAAWDDTDGLPAASAHVSFPRSIGLDSAGNAWISDAYHTIRRRDGKTGIITTVCGTARTPGFSGDGGPAAAARVHDPNFLAVAPDGTVYFLDFNNARIRRISPDGVIATIAGTGASGSAGDGGPAIQAALEMVPNDTDSDAIAFDPRGFLYFGETRSGRVRRIDLATGNITLFKEFRDETGGPNWPRIRSLAVDVSGNVYVGMYTQIFKLAPDGSVLTSWGKHKVEGFSPDGTLLTEILLGEGKALALDRDGNLLYTDGLVGRVRRLNFQTGKVEGVAGNPPQVFGVPGPAIGAVLDAVMDDLAFLPNGDLLFGDMQSLDIFRINASGNISVAAGSGTFLGGSVLEKPVLGANVAGVAALETDSLGGYYWANSGPIMYVDPGGIGHRIAGFGGFDQAGYSGDGGPAAAARLTQPWDVVLDRTGNIFIADTNNNRIRRIDAKTSIITTVAGAGPSNGFEGYGHGADCGDGGPAVDACLNTPYAVAVDPEGTLFISDSGNQRIRKVDSHGIITTFSEIYGTKLITDPNGVLFTNTGNTVDRFRPDGRRSPVAGMDTAHGFSGDGGPAAAALISNGGIADGIAIDREGNLFFHDANNRRIRAVRFGAVLAPPGAAAEIPGGSLQSAPAGRRFPVPLEVLVRGADGVPEPSVRVDFTAPPGPLSCVFSNGTNTISVLTDRSGKARASCTASCQPGAYAVSGTPLGSATVLEFSLTNTPSPAGRSRCTKPIPFRE